MESSSRESSCRPRPATRLHRLARCSCSAVARSRNTSCPVSCTEMRSAAPAVARIMPSRRTRVAGPIVPARAGQRHHVGAHGQARQGDASPARVRHVRHEHALQQVDEIEVGVAPAGQVDAVRHQRDVEQRPRVEDGQDEPALGEGVPRQQREGMVPAMATPIRTKNGRARQRVVPGKKRVEKQDEEHRHRRRHADRAPTAGAPRRAPPAVVRPDRRVVVAEELAQAAQSRDAGAPRLVGAGTRSRSRQHGRDDVRCGIRSVVGWARTAFTGRRRQPRDAARCPHRQKS